MTHSTIYVGNTSLIRVDALTDNDGNYVNDATVIDVTVSIPFRLCRGEAGKFGSIRKAV